MNFKKILKVGLLIIASSSLLSFISDKTDGFIKNPFEEDKVQDNDKPNKKEIIECNELPSLYKGTPVPTEAYVEKLYFNTNLSIDEVKKIMDEVVYYTIEDMSLYFSNVVFCTSDMSYAILISHYNGTSDFSQAHYEIAILDVTNETKTKVFVWNDVDGEEGEGQDGWKGIESITIGADNATAIYASQLNVVCPNDKLSKLISSTPFEKNKIEEGQIYKVEKTKLYLLDDGIVSDYEELNNLSSLKTKYEIVDELPSENIVHSNVSSLMYLYLCKTDNKSYYHFGEKWIEQYDFYFVNSYDEIKDNEGNYLLLTYEYYIYENGQFNEYNI